MENVASVADLNVASVSWLYVYGNEVVSLDVQMVEIRSLRCLGSL